MEILAVLGGREHSTMKMIRAIALRSGVRIDAPRRLFAVKVRPSQAACVTVWPNSCRPPLSSAQAHIRKRDSVVPEAHTHRGCSPKLRNERNELPR
jgi:hypothetical protein